MNLFDEVSTISISLVRNKESLTVVASEALRVSKWTRFSNPFLASVSLDIVSSDLDALISISALRESQLKFSLEGGRSETKPKFSLLISAASCLS